MPHTSFTLSNLRRRVNRLHQKKKNEETRRKNLEESHKNTQECLLYLEGIFLTHRATDIPAHTSEESLFFFKNRRDESCLITELKPSPKLMPEMRRISVTQAKTRKMRCGEIGFVLQRVVFSITKGRHEQVIFCPKRCIIEKIL